MVKLSSMGFKNGKDVKVKRRLLMSIEGLPKHGKSHFILTAPAPIVIFEFDVGLDDLIVNSFQHKKNDLYLKEYSIPNFFEAAQIGTFDYVSTWNQVLSTYRDVLNSDARTIVFDTGTEAYELIRMARLGKLTEVLPHHYTKVNTEFRELIRLANDSDKNFILTHKMKDEYVKNVNTGKLVRASYKGIEYDAHVLCGIHREGTEFTLTVNECRQNIGIVDMELEGVMCTFPFLASMVFPGTSLEDWE